MKTIHQGEKRCTLKLTIRLDDKTMHELTAIAVGLGEQSGINVQEETTINLLALSVSTAVLLFYDLCQPGQPLEHFSVRPLVPAERATMQPYSLTLDIHNKAEAHLREFAKSEQLTLEDAVVVAVVSYIALLRRTGSILFELN